MPSNVSSMPSRSQAFARGARMLRTALGPAIAGWLEDPGVVEVMLNPDGRLWIDRLSSGLADTGERLSPEDGERILRLVAHHVGAEVHAGAPRLSAELPETGERFEGLIPPVAVAPTFAIRKPAVAVFTLADYAACGIMTAVQAEALGRAVAERKNILVAGGTSTGKTTLVNALLAEVAKTSDPRGPDRGHARAPVLGPEPGGAPHQRRRGQPVGSGPRRAPAPPRPHPHRRGPGRRGAGPAEGLGHRPPRWDRDAARWLGVRRAPPPGAADPRGCGHRAPAP